MKNCIIALALISLSSFTLSTHAEETMGEKATVVGKDTKRAAKKGVHRVEEGVCGKLTGDSKVECMAKKAGNRATEAKDATVDKASEMKNAVDSDEE